jgi:hypothetical protein
MDAVLGSDPDILEPAPSQQRLFVGYLPIDADMDGPITAMKVPRHVRGSHEICRSSVAIFWTEGVSFRGFTQTPSVSLQFAQRTTKGSLNGRQATTRTPRA